MASAIRHDKLRLKINSLVQMVRMILTKDLNLWQAKVKVRCEVSKLKTKDGITCCQVRVKEYLRRHWLMNTEQWRNYNWHEKTEETWRRTCSSATSSPWIWSHPGLNMSLCGEKPVFAFLCYCTAQWICLLQSTKGEAIKHKTLTETFRLITLNFSCAAASSEFAWYKAWRLGSTSQ